MERQRLREDPPVELDDQGYLIDPADWSEALAEALACEEGIVLTEAHWAVIRFVREWYAVRRIAPDARHVIKHLAAWRGENSEGRNELFRLFPYGYVKQACRIAGMRKPRAWSTG
ncbi:MAG TPA: TusE/DsrC/DsvC family sulfur relay protein [Burkholderiales bacterium]|nr:TusE/DsrC/DsvC family sulfur relay protein [Burkholderiales bacterium]